MAVLFTDIKNLFTKDTSSEGESSKLLVVLRILFGSIVLYSLINLIFCLAIGNQEAVLFFGAALVFYGFMLYGSYRLRMVSLVIASNVISLAFVTVGYLLLGPNVAIQNFFIVIVVTSFFSGYGHYKIKGIFTILVFVLYYYLQSYLSTIIPTFAFTVSGKFFLQLMNIVTSFWCVSIVCYVFSKESQHLEGKLIEYNKILR